MAEDHQHWADQMALYIKERTEKDPELKKMVKEHGYIVYDEKTPSGEIHVGSGRRSSFRIGAKSITRMPSRPIPGYNLESTGE